VLLCQAVVLFFPLLLQFCPVLPSVLVFIMAMKKYEAANDKQQGRRRGVWESRGGWVSVFDSRG